MKLHLPAGIRKKLAYLELEAIYRLSGFKPQKLPAESDYRFFVPIDWPASSSARTVLGDDLKPAFVLLEVTYPDETRIVRAGEKMEKTLGAVAKKYGFEPVSEGPGAYAGGIFGYFVRLDLPKQVSQRQPGQDNSPFQMPRLQ
ncbi:MAG: hypothetical protein V1820_04505 [archaeon]